MKNNYLFENKNREIAVASLDGYYLVKEDFGLRGFLYSIYDPEGNLVYNWRSFLDVEQSKDIKKTGVYQMFAELVRQDIEGEYTDNPYDDFDPYIEDEEEEEDDTIIDVDDEDIIDDDEGYYDSLFFGNRSRNKKHNSSNLNQYRHHTYYYKPLVKEKGYVDRLCNSNTLVFHKNDSTTRMLCQIYEGKDWDVLTTSCDRIDTEEVKQLFEKHDRLIFLGHGTSYGLIGMFGPEVAPYMKDKKIFAIWCNADGYFKEHNIGQGQFITGNMPSEVWECSSAGCGHISRELMLENITYWSKLCADVVEECLEGDPQKGVDYVRQNYLEKYGNHPVTIYNSERTQCLGQEKPLPKYTFKGEPLEEKDYPIPHFDEAEFLKNPTAKASECPVKEEE